MIKANNNANAKQDGKSIIADMLSIYNQLIAQFKFRETRTR